MTILVRYFARIREETGLGQELVVIPPDATVSDLLQELSRRHDVVAQLLPSLRCGVNDRYVALSHNLRDGDDVAVLSPVSGG